MKHNYILYILLFIIVLFRGSFINLINNIGYIFLVKDNNIEKKILEKRINTLTEEYNNLLTFKNNINITEKYTITNRYINNYGYDKLFINGNNYQLNDEVINSDGLIGIITKINKKYSEVSYIYDTNIAIKINDTYGKIVGKDNDNNLIVKQLSNYVNININDKVYSSYDTYIGKVIKINTENFDTSIVVSTINTKSNKYLAVISRQV